MNIKDITTSEQLRSFMTEPSPQLVEFMKNLDGNILVLGGSGKMGPELVEMILRADQQAGVQGRKVMVASTFSDPTGTAIRLFKDLGVWIYKGDLSNKNFLESLPEAEYIIYMPGFKFGSSGDWEKSVASNCIMPYLIGERFQHSSIAVFSSANPYGHTHPDYKGSKETDTLDPKGIYGWSIIARESTFRITAKRYPGQKAYFYRLAYAQHLAYGVIIDLALMLIKKEQISLAMPYVNLVSQRDANDRALRGLNLCANPPATMNVSGPSVSVKYIVEQLGKHLKISPELTEDSSGEALIINDNLCIQQFGSYRDSIEDMITAAANWAANKGEYWDKPTLFGRVAHNY